MAHQTIPTELRDEFMKIVNTGDEAKARDFLIENLSKFPEDTQEVITMAFIEEALVKKGQDDKLITDFKKQGLETAQVINHTKAEFEKHAALAKIKENI